MPSSGMLHCVALVRTNVSEKYSTFIIRVTISELGTLAVTRSMHQLLVTANVVPSSLILVTLMMEALCSSKMSVLTRATWCNITEDGILQMTDSLRELHSLKSLGEIRAIDNIHSINTEETWKRKTHSGFGNSSNLFLHEP
jgi:hypothetical protein